MNVRKILQEGFVAGLIGAGAVAAWMLLVDTVAGRAFFVPAALGNALFWHVTDPSRVEIAFPPVVAYTMVHVVAFVLVGIVGAFVIHQVERLPSTLFIAAAAFCLFEFGFYVILALFARPLLGVMAWWNVAVGNLIAGAGMGYYLWHSHPRLQARLREHPLGEPMDQDDEDPGDDEAEPSPTLPRPSETR